MTTLRSTKGEHYSQSPSPSTSKISLLFQLLVISMLISSCAAAAAAVQPPSFALSSLVSSSRIVQALSPIQLLPPAFKPSFRISLPDDIMFHYGFESTSVVNAHRGGGGGIVDKSKNIKKKQQNKKDQHNDKKTSTNDVMTTDKKPTVEDVNTDAFSTDMNADANCNKEFLTRIGVESFLSVILIAMGEYQAKQSNFATTILCRISGVAIMCAVLAELTTVIGEDAIKVVGAAVVLMGFLLLLQM